MSCIHCPCVCRRRHHLQRQYRGHVRVVDQWPEQSTAFALGPNVPRNRSANLYNDGVTNNGASGTQTLTFVVPTNAPDSLHYNCGNHTSMNGPITIITDEIFSDGFEL